MAAESVAASPAVFLRGARLEREPLAEHTSWRVGGPAERFYQPADLGDLVEFLRSLPPDEPLLWLGLGSNVLVRDGGIRGTVVCTKNRLRAIEARGPSCVYAEAGLPCAHIARFGADRDWVGAEFLAGIPGTLGGALAMNAGAFGGETWRLVRRVFMVNRSGRTIWRVPDEFEVGYRHVHGPEGEWFLAAELELAPGDGRAGRERIKSLLARRTATQPTHQPSCGSVFRNPPGDFAARLIEACGLKGHAVGGAQVSAKHANFIVNSGNATAADIEALISEVRNRVALFSGIWLQPEVRIVGEPLA
jgi:UDP-N-acetylmuramate dehydrogenase